MSSTVASRPERPATGDSWARWKPVRWNPALWAAGVVSTLLALQGTVALAVGRVQLDMAVYLLGGLHLIDGRLYTASLPYPPYLPFTYPPFSALGFASLDVFSEGVAQVVWALVNVVALFGLIWLALRAARPGLSGAQLVMWSLVMMWPACWIEPVRLTFYFGQVNVVLATMVLADLTLTLRAGRRTLPRGVLVGVAAAVKLIPLVFVPYLFLTRQTRAAWVSIATFVGCAAASAAVDPQVSWTYWTKYLADAKRVGTLYYISNQSLQAVIERLDHQVVPTGLLTAASALAVLLGVLLAAWAFRSSSVLLGALLCATTGLIASPVTWAHHMVWTVPILIWLVCAPDRPAGGWMWAAGGGLLFWLAPIWAVPYGGTRELHEHGWQLLLGNSFFLGSVVFMVGMAAMLWMRRRHCGFPNVQRLNDEVLSASGDAV